MPRPELSLCLIVRDEAEMLPGLLESVAGLWDELIAVDSGSTDRTVEILTDAGARVIPFTWIDDFSAARNASLAAATGRWILFLDADERLSPRLKEQIRALLADESAGAATVLMRNEVPGGQVRLAPLLRLFRNDPAVHFEHRIHEDPSRSVLALLERTGRVMRHLDGAVDHLGYVREVAADRNKKERDLALLRRSVEADSEDFYCWFKILEIARFWNDPGLWRHTARTAADRFLAASPDAAAALRAAHWSGEFAALLAQGLHEDPAARVAWLDEHIDRIRPSATWHLRRGLDLEADGRPDEAATAYDAGLALAIENASPHAQVRPLLGLCRLAAARRDAETAARLAREATSLGPLDPEALLALAAFHPAANGESLAAPLRDLLTIHPDAAVPLARALVASGAIAGAADCLRPTAANDPEAALGLLVCTLILGEAVDLQLDTTREIADELMRGWVETLLGSGRPAVIRDFLIASPVLAETFPWLEKLLEQKLGS